MSKKTTIVIIVILIAILILGIVGYKVATSYVWTADGKVEDGKALMMEHIRNEKDPKAKEEMVQMLLEDNKLTQAEADDLLGK